MGLKITVTAAGEPSVVIAQDDSGDLARSGLSVNEERAIDIQGVLRSAFVKIFDRDNAVKRITFQTQKIHSSPIEAHRFMLDHCDTVPSFGLVKLEITDGVETFNRWMPNAGVRSVNIPRVLGCSTWQTYEIIGGQVLKNNPKT